jgi:hypothetical protein
LRHRSTTAGYFLGGRQSGKSAFGPTAIALKSYWPLAATFLAFLDFPNCLGFLRALP